MLNTLKYGSKLNMRNVEIIEIFEEMQSIGV